MLLLGGIGFHFVVAGMLLRRPPASYRAVQGTVKLSKSPGGKTGMSLRSKVWNSVDSFLCLDVFRSLEFILVSIIRMLFSIACGGAIVYMVSNGLALGLSAREASFLTTAWGCGDLFGVALSVLALHKTALSVHRVLGIASVASALGLFLEPFVSNVIGQIAVVFVAGAGMGGVVETGSLMTRRLPFDDDEFVIVLGWQFFLSGSAVCVCDVIAGWSFVRWSCPS